MAILAIIIGLFVSFALSDLNNALFLNGSGDGLQQKAVSTEGRTAGGASAQASSLTCKLQTTAREPALFMDGDFIIGGVFSLHYDMDIVDNDYTTVPEQQKCTGRSVEGRGGGGLLVTLYWKCLDLYDAAVVLIIVSKDCVIFKTVCNI